MSLDVLGWREWVALPQLGIGRIKAKVDTGARTSALHAFQVDVVDTAKGSQVNFLVHPMQGDNEQVVSCTAPLLEYRTVRDSGGHEEQRCVIETEVVIGGVAQQIEMTLTNRDNMGFRMLLGRTTLRGKYLVDPGRSWLAGKIADEGPSSGG